MAKGELQVTIMTAEGLRMGALGMYPACWMRLRLVRLHDTQDYMGKKVGQFDSRVAEPAVDNFQMQSTVAGPLRHSDHLVWRWDQHFVVDVDDAATSKVQITLWDPSQPFGSPIAFLGEVMLNVAKMLPYSGQHIEQDFSIRQGKKLPVDPTAGIQASGSLRLHMVFSKADLRLTVDPRLEVTAGEAGREQGSTSASPIVVSATPLEGRHDGVLVGAPSAEIDAPQHGRNVGQALEPEKPAVTTSHPNTATQNEDNNASIEETFGPTSTATSPESDAADPQAVPSPLLFYRGASTQSAVESLQLVSLSPMKHSPARSPDKLSRAGSSSHSPVRGPSADRQRSSQAKLLPALPPPDQPSQPLGAEGLGGRSVGSSAAGGACSVSSSLVRAPVAAPVAAESEASEPTQAVCIRS